MKNKIWLLAVWIGASLFNCAGAAAQSALPTVDDYFPAAPTNLVFHPFRADVYTVGELLTNYDTNDPKSYYSTTDWRIYTCYTNFVYDKKHGHLDELTARYMRLHDLTIEEALDKYIRTCKGVVGIMGGHDMERKVFLTTTGNDGQVTNAGYAPYMKVALLARSLATNGFTILTGGGPGAMEAGNLGAWMAGYPEAELTNAVRILESVPKSTNSALWLHLAFMVMNQYTNANCHSNNIGVPTWFYGSEPPNPFATHIAKYFENSLREEHLLAVSQGGIIFAPGSAGTVQELFQSACQNYYGNYTTNKFPMVLYNVDYWNRPTYGSVDVKDKPAWPLLRQLGEEKNFGQQLMISDDIDAIASFICTNRINQIKP
jgi:predicted Rossmann-fold nucleotide-binding protein